VASGKWQALQAACMVAQTTGAMTLTFARDPLGAGLNSTVTRTN